MRGTCASVKTLNVVLAIAIILGRARRCLNERAIPASVYRTCGRSIARCSPWRPSLLPPTLVSSPSSTSYAPLLLFAIDRASRYIPARDGGAFVRAPIMRDWKIDSSLRSAVLLVILRWLALSRRTRLGRRSEFALIASMLH